jgi:hypothetical protein
LPSGLTTSSAAKACVGLLLLLNRGLASVGLRPLLDDRRAAALRAPPPPLCADSSSSPSSPTAGKKPSTGAYIRCGGLYAGWDGGGLIRFFILRTAIDFAWHPVETCEG